jgi:hypothetical protein
MKKIFIIAVILISFCGFSDSEAETKNLLLDPSFEGDCEYGWGLYGDATYDTNTYRNGAKSAKAWVWDYGDGLFEQYVNIVPGQKYKASVYIYSASSDPIEDNSAAWIQVEWCTDDEVIISDAIKSPVLTSANNSWQKFSTPAIVAPEAATKAKIKIIHLAPGDQTPGACYFDDAEFSIVE